MRLVVQIPCLNEEDNIAAVIGDVRVATAGYDDVKILVIDDGSTDATQRVAAEAGADYIAAHVANQGLARAYITGLTAALNVGADVIVNTDADNQYDARGIPDLIAPILAGEADLVVGARPIADTEHMSPLKKVLQRLGSWTLRVLSGTTVKDATSGFRAMNRETAIRTNTFSEYTYTLETLIQAGRSGVRVASVDIATHPPTRPSRLLRSMWNYVVRSAIDMLRIYTIYAPLRTYAAAGCVPLAVALLLGLRYVVLVTFVDPTRTHAPSLILAAALAIVGCLLWALGVIGELMTVNRRLLEEIRIGRRHADAAEGVARARSEFVLTTLGDGNAR